MLMFTGTLAAFFYTTLIGMIVPPRSGEGACEYLLGAIARSLLISWGVVFVCYVTKLPTLFWPSIVLVLVLSIYTWRQRNNRKHLSGRWGRGALTILAGISFAMTFYLVLGGEYKAIFNGWDSVVSWNRWAIELSEGHYEPQNAAYPILWPGIWSLIYRAQGDNTVWIVAKASTFVIPAIGVLAVGMLIERGKYVAALFGAVYMFWFFFVGRADPMLDGMMDAPVAILMFAAACSMIASINSGRLLTTSILVGLAATTKQAGALMLVPYAILLVGFTAWNRVDWKGALSVGVIAVAPLVTFLVMYLPLEPDPTGNLSYLQSLANARSADAGSSAERAFGLIVAMWHPVALLALVCVGFFNFARPFGLSNVLGTIFLLIAVIGAFIFADCCSYEPRNGWWIISMIVASAMFATRKVDSILAWRDVKESVPKHRGWPVTVLCAAVATSALMLLVDDKEAKDAQYGLQWKILWPNVNRLLRDNLEVIGDDGKIISPYQIVGYLPEIGDQYVKCYPNGDDCALDTIRAEERSFLLVSETSGYPSLYEGLADAAFLGEADGWRLYGPITSANLR